MEAEQVEAEEGVVSLVVTHGPCMMATTSAHYTMNLQVFPYRYKEVSLYLLNFLG